jgi:hypothetical protein
MGEAECPAETTLVVKKRTILLGETKYYKAKPDPENPAKLIIEESITVPSNPAPVDAEFVVSSTSGDRLGVYWERRNPGGTLLPRGWIRLIGRFWKADMSYKVRLTATGQSPGGRGSIELEVKRPDSLGRENNVSEDIDGHSYNLDSLIIFWAGKEGIPPQMLKAQIKHETEFNPAHRYEPHKDVQYQNRRADSTFMADNAYWIVNAGNIGVPEPPAGVANLRDGRVSVRIQYPGYSGTVWEFFDGHRYLYASSMRKVFKNTWESYVRDELSKIRRSLTQADTIASHQVADDRLWEYLRYRYAGGFDNHTAQTRIMASYGLLQLVYYYALSEDNYPHDRQSTLVNQRLNPPERLNDSEHYYFSYAVHHLKTKFALSEVFSNESNWEDGFETTWRLTLNAYNGNQAGAGIGRCPVGNERIDYGSQVMCWYTTLFHARTH